MNAYDLPDIDVRSEIMHKIIWISRKHLQLNAAKLEETGLGGRQVPVLIELMRWGELSQRELAEKLRVTPATISGMLKRMERSGFVSRTADKNDARIFRVRLTEAGRARCDYARQVFDDNVFLMMEGLNEEEIQSLGAMLTRIMDNVGGAMCQMPSIKGSKGTVCSAISSESMGK